MFQTTTWNQYTRCVFEVLTVVLQVHKLHAFIPLTKKYQHIDQKYGLVQKKIEKDTLVMGMKLSV